MIVISTKNDRIEAIFLSDVCIHIIVKKLKITPKNQTGNMNLFMNLSYDKPDFYIHIFSYAVLI